MKDWIFYVVTLIICAIFSLLIILLYNKEAREEVHYEKPHLQEYITPAYDESQMNQDAKM